MYVLSNSPEDAPDEPTYVEIEMDKGIPVALDGKKACAGPAVRAPERTRRDQRYRARGHGRERWSDEESRRL